MNSTEMLTANWMRSLRCHLFSGSGLVGLLTALALVVYIGGFRAADFSWYDAIGAGTTHVFPGAFLGVFPTSRAASCMPNAGSATPC